MPHAGSDHVCGKRPQWIPRYAYRYGLSAAPPTVAAAASSTSALQATAASPTTSAAHKQLYALLLSSCKLAAVACEWQVPAASAKVAAAMINLLCKETQPPSAAMLPAAVPWLHVMARAGVAAAKWTAAEIRSFPQKAPAVAMKDGASNQELEAIRLRSFNRTMHDVVGALPRLSEYLRPFAHSIQQQRGTEPMSATAVLQPLLVQLLAQWDRDLLPHVRQAEMLLWSVLHPANPDGVLKQLSPAATAIAQQVAALTGTGEPQLHFDKLSVVLNSHLVRDLPQQLKAAALQLSALLPLPLCCNNASCSNMSRQSELQLVGGKSCVCAGCEVARYCGRGCQASHRQAHKKVCKMIKNRAANVTS